MCNQSAIRVHCRLGDEVIADRTAHIINAETGGTAAIPGDDPHARRPPMACSPPIR